MSPVLHRSSSLFALALFAVPGAAFADEFDDAPAPIVVTGERIDEPEASSIKTDTPLLDTPQSITTLGRERLDDQGLEQLNDALRYVPGVILNQGEGHRDQIAIRGQSTTADFYLDGIRDDAQYYRSLYNIERVEVLKGANALLFGRGGGGGVINRVSKAPDFIAPHSTLSVSGNSFGAWSGSGDLGLPVSDALAVRFNGTYEEFANRRDEYTGHFIGLAPTVGLKLGERTILTAAYEFAGDKRTTDRGIPSFGGVPLTGFDDTFFGDPAINRSTVTAHIARVRLDHEFAEGLSFNAAGQFSHYDKYYGNIVPGAVNAARTMVSLTGYRSGTQRSNWIGQANLVWKGETGPLRHTLLAGIEAGDQDTAAYRDDSRFAGAASVSVPLLRQITVPASTWVTLSKTRSQVRSLSGYVQDQIELGEHVQLIAGARYDDFRIIATNRITGVVTARNDGKWSPRFGLVLKPQANVSLYASYTKSFLPQAGDQFNTLAANLQTLAPEEFRNLEAGVKWDISPGLSFTSAVFQIDRTNTRAVDPNTGNPVLTGSSRVKGYEVALSGQITPAWQASLGYSHQTGKILTTTTAAPAGRLLPQLPRDQLTAWTRYNMSARLGVGLGLLHQSSQFATISNAVTLPGFTRLDAAVYFDVTERFAVQFNIENLTGTKYFASAQNDNNIQPGEPLTARVTARVKF